MKRIIIYCIATLLIAIGAFLFFPKSSEVDPSSEDKSNSIVQGKFDEEAIAIEKNSNSVLANATASVAETPEVIDLSDKVKSKVGGLPRWKIYVDEEMANEIGLDRREKAEVERIIDYYKKEMDQINLNNATVSTLSDNKFVIKIAKAGKQGIEVSNILREEILIAIGEEKFNRLMEFDKNKLSGYFRYFGQSPRTLEIEVKKSSSILGEVVEIKDKYEDYGYSTGSRLSLNGSWGSYKAVGTLISP